MGLEDSLVQLLAVMLPQSIPVDAKMSRYVVLSDTKCHRAFDNGPSLFIRLVGGLPPLLTGTGAFSSVMRGVTRKTLCYLRFDRLERTPLSHCLNECAAR
jgi:hypothetical protein